MDWTSWLLRKWILSFCTRCSYKKDRGSNFDFVERNLKTFLIGMDLEFCVESLKVFDMLFLIYLICTKFLLLASSLLHTSFFISSIMASRPPNKAVCSRHLPLIPSLFCSASCRTRGFPNQTTLAVWKIYGNRTDTFFSLSIIPCTYCTWLTEFKTKSEEMSSYRLILTSVTYILCN